MRVLHVHSGNLYGGVESCPGDAGARAEVGAQHAHQLRAVLRGPLQRRARGARPGAASARRRTPQPSADGPARPRRTARPVAAAPGRCRGVPAAVGAGGLRLRGARPGIPGRAVAPHGRRRPALARAGRALHRARRGRVQQPLHPGTDRPLAAARAGPRGLLSGVGAGSVRTRRATRAPAPVGRGRRSSGDRHVGARRGLEGAPRAD